MDDLYQYVGPRAVLDRAGHVPAGVRIASAADLLGWVRATGQRPNTAGLIPATFVVDADGHLLVADRASEHVACSGQRAVRSAGEMFFRVAGGGVAVEEVSNQSTGFCPRPSSWAAVAAALDRIGLPHPGRFTTPVEFRRCPACGQRNVVRDGWFACAVCGADLPAEWNF